MIFRAYLEELLNKEREAKDQEFFKHPYHWNQLPQGKGDINLTLTPHVKCFNVQRFLMRVTW